MICKVVWIMGNNFCGSTMLGLMLGNHPDSITIGEVVNLWQNKSVSCVRCGSVQKCNLKQILYRYPLEEWYRVISEVEGKEYIIDSSKVPHWFNMLIDVGIISRYDIYSIWLYKDPLRQIGSIVKHRTRIGNDKESSLEIAKQQFVSSLKACRDVYHVFDEKDRLFMDYKALASDPEMVIDAVCTDAGLPYTPGMHEFWNNNHSHNIGGNVGARYMLQPDRVSGIINTQHFKHYAQNRNSVFLDDSYKNYLNRDDIISIMKDENIEGILTEIAEEQECTVDDLMVP
jgi:hypothetical protein